VAAEYFTDELADLGSKDAATQTRGVWIIELSELDNLSHAEVAWITVDSQCSGFPGLTSMDALPSSLPYIFNTRNTGNSGNGWQELGGAPTRNTWNPGDDAAEYVNTD